jgi:hypothetical protein
MRIATGSILTVLFLMAGFTVAMAGPAEELAAKNIDRIEAGCQTELETYCKTVTPGEGRGLACIYAHSDKISAKCETALYASAKEFQNAAKNLNAFAGACQADIEKLCSKVAIGEGRVLKCLEESKAKVSADCNEVRQKAKGDLGQLKDIDYQYHTARIR